MLGPGRYCGDSGVVPRGPFGRGIMLLGGDWIIGYSLRLSWLSAQFAPPFPLSSLRSPGGWTLGFTGSGLQYRSRPRMDLACSPRVPVDAESSQLCWIGGYQWAPSSPGAWRLSVPPRPGASSALDFRASGLRADTFTQLLLASLLMWLCGSPLPHCISLGYRVVEIAS
ncbi:hypothetical protein NDU88_005255 [Pleurodeles waltl]|uniref:Uncharacterized protein n=1 Tax=Pleurodeles waltl TaxID=8319 RepID=A0AAV7W7B6_PLEWA|nr:hypothetical protein NDU88_005255 [Pleurodeles waltl]